MLHLDTHVLLWLHQETTGRLPAAVINALDQEPLIVSPMVKLELGYLFEVGKVTPRPDALLDELRPRLEFRESTTSFGEIVVAALPLTWTRDPFDRLIAANALADGARLLTADRNLLAHLPDAVWD